MVSVEGSHSVRKEGKNKVLHIQSRQIVYNVSRYKKEEKESTGGHAVLKNIQEKVCEATGVSF
jgi:hypothetical protein